MLLTNSFEGITPSGTTLTSGSGGNTGGTSGSYFDAVAATGTGPILASDSTRSAHGSLSLKIATGSGAGASHADWVASLSYAGSQLWWRQYLYFTANPAATFRVLTMSPSSGNDFQVFINTTGTVRVNNSSGAQMTVSTASIPLNAWFRIEGFCIFSATVGQTELKLFTTSMDATSPDETDTSAATYNTNNSIGAATHCLWGISGSALANAGPYWMDDVAVSDGGYIGPVSTSGGGTGGLPAATGVPPAPTPSVSLAMTIQGV